MNKINSENPAEHWGFLNVKGKVVLDLGCGRLASEITTPEYFRSQGAEQVICVDILQSEVDYFRGKGFVCLCADISNPWPFSALLSEFQPQVVKMDTEGGEMLLKYFYFSLGLDEMAIEYHNSEAYELIKSRYKHWGFTNCEIYQLITCDVNHQGVAYLSK